MAASDHIQSSDLRLLLSAVASKENGLRSHLSVLFQWFDRLEAFSWMFSRNIWLYLGM